MCVRPKRHHMKSRKVRYLGEIHVVLVNSLPVAQVDVTEMLNLTHAHLSKLALLCKDKHIKSTSFSTNTKRDYLRSERPCVNRTLQIEAKNKPVQTRVTAV